MSHVSLDAFQLLVAFYLFFTAAKGSGTLYNFPEVPKKKQEPLRQLLRKIYAVCGVISLLDGCVSMLQNAMFTVAYTESGMEITQNFTINALPFLSYGMLSAASTVLTVLFILLLAAVVIIIRKQ